MSHIWWWPGRIQCISETFILKTTELTVIWYIFTTLQMLRQTIRLYACTVALTNRWNHRLYIKKVEIIWHYICHMCSWRSVSSNKILVNLRKQTVSFVWMCMVQFPEELQAQVCFHSMRAVTHQPLGGAHYWQFVSKPQKHSGLPFSPFFPCDPQTSVCNFSCLM